MYKHKFDKNRRRVKKCPCGLPNRTKFSPFEGYDDKGHCFKCGKTFYPVIQEPSPNDFAHWKSNHHDIESVRKPISTINQDTLSHSLDNYHNNNFVEFLVSLFGIEVTEGLISKYMIGTSAHWLGSTLFWLVDQQMQIRSGKIMLYDRNSGKRIKHPKSFITWFHKAPEILGFKLQTCLFGEHLLAQASREQPIAIVESEKTAIIASVDLPDYIWMATGGLSSLNAHHMAPLKGRKVVLYPDLNALERWSELANRLSKFASISISSLLEENATEQEREQGLDLADYLIKNRFNNG